MKSLKLAVLTGIVAVVLLMTDQIAMAGVIPNRKLNWQEQITVFFLTLNFPEGLDRYRSTFQQVLFRTVGENPIQIQVHPGMSELHLPKDQIRLTYEFHDRAIFGNSSTPCHYWSYQGPLSSDDPNPISLGFFVTIQGEVRMMSSLDSSTSNLTDSTISNIPKVPNSWYQYILNASDQEVVFNAQMLDVRTAPHPSSSLASTSTLSSSLSSLSSSSSSFQEQFSYCMTVMNQQLNATGQTVSGQVKSLNRNIQKQLSTFCEYISQSLEPKDET